MEFRTIIAKKVGTCARCEQPIYVGDKIRWAAGRGAYHLSAECPAVERTLVPVGVTETGVEFAPVEYVTTTHDGPNGLVRKTELRPIREVDRTVLVQQAKLPDADEMLAAFGVKS